MSAGLFDYTEACAEMDAGKEGFVHWMAKLRQFHGFRGGLDSWVSEREQAMLALIKLREVCRPFEKDG